MNCRGTEVYDTYTQNVAKGNYDTDTQKVAEKS